jgi:hypothetical protein
VDAANHLLYNLIKNQTFNGDNVSKKFAKDCKKLLLFFKEQNIENVTELLEFLNIANSSILPLEIIILFGGGKQNCLKSPNYYQKYISSIKACHYLINIFLTRSISEESQRLSNLDLQSAFKFACLKYMIKDKRFTGSIINNIKFDLNDLYKSKSQDASNFIKSVLQDKIQNLYKEKQDNFLTEACSYINQLSSKLQNDICKFAKATLDSWNIDSLEKLDFNHIYESCPKNYNPITLTYQQTPSFFERILCISPHDLEYSVNDLIKSLGATIIEV